MGLRKMPVFTLLAALLITLSLLAACTSPQDAPTEGARPTSFPTSTPAQGVTPTPSPASTLPPAPTRRRRPHLPPRLSSST